MVREAIESLRSCFRPHDPHHHTLDTLEQVLVRTFISVTSFLSLMLELWRIHFINVLSQLFQIFCCLSSKQCISVSVLCNSVVIGEKEEHKQY